jgi:hypothetical protein
VVDHLYVRSRVSRLAVSFLAGLAIVTATPPAAHAAAPELPTFGATVSVKSPARHVGTVLRFPRSRIALTQRSHGRLIVSAAGRRRTLRVRARRALRLRVTVDRLARRVTAAIGPRGVRLRSAVRAGDRIVAGRHVALVSVDPVRPPRAAPTPIERPSVHPVAPATPTPKPTATPTPTPRPTATPSPTATPTASPTPMPTGDVPVARRPPLFAASSVWRQRLADDAELDPASDTLVKTLRDTVAQTQAWIGWRGTTPLYVVPASQPTVPVMLDNPTLWWRAPLQQAFTAVPIPANAIPAEGNDGHLTVWQPSTNKLWELFRARRLDDGWHAAWGGAMKNTSASPGYYNAESWPGLSDDHWGATATSLPVIAGTMLIDELNAGTIPHALALNIPWAKPNVYSWPAQRTDGRSTDPNAIPEGAHFRLDPQLDISKLNLPPVVRMMATAAQRYGIIVRDQTGSAVGFFAENTTQFGLNPYTATDGMYGGTPANVLLRSFPWESLKLVKMDLRTMP